MEKIAIITDSCGDVSSEYQKEHAIFVLPMVVQTSDGEYKDGVTITAKEVYEKQKNEVLKTASPTGADICDLFEKVKAEGYTHAIVVTLSSGLSGTCNQVKLLAEMEEDLEVYVIDSKSGSVGYGAVAVLLAKYRDAGHSFEELVKIGEKLVLDSYVYFSIDTLEHLEKGGRIGKAAALVGGLLNIKPILSFDKEQGEIFVPAKVRGRKGLQPKLMELVETHIKEYPERQYWIVVADGGLTEEHVELEEKLKEKYPNCQGMLHGVIGGALSTYLGAGLLGAGIVFV